MTKMAIASLSPSTVRLLGSAQVLTTPASLIKELIDNALDAKATSIDILISKNTLDKLEVRDNGHGIASEDFDSLGKRGHTSKLRSFEELNFVGGITLGFRGEALASAVQLGEVSVTTKTEGESVATRLVLKNPGGVDQKIPTSHPVGTTVSVQKFMYKMPVRKKTFEKEASRTLTKISQLLRSYALARYSIRFSLKITGGGKWSWSFAPRPHSGIREASSLVIGRDAAMECIEKSLVSAEHLPKTAVVLSEDHGADSGFNADSKGGEGSFVMEAFLPNSNADPSKIGTGQYLSIDSRPVSHEKGTMKKIITLFKKYIRGALANSSENMKNPFMRLNIKCPVGSYDPNIEPAKDDVLFCNEFIILELAENLLKGVYGELKIVPGVSSSKSLSYQLDNFDLLLARDPHLTETLMKEVSQDPVAVSGTSPAPSKQVCLPEISPGLLGAGGNLAAEMEDPSHKQLDEWGRKLCVSRYKDFKDEVDGGHQRGRPKNVFKTHPQQQSESDISTPLLNPWMIAKINTATGRNQVTSDSSVTHHRPLSDIITPPQLRNDTLDETDELVRAVTLPRQTFRNIDARTIQPSAARRRNSASQALPVFNEERSVLDFTVPTESRYRNGFMSARCIPEDGLISPPCTVSKTTTITRGPSRPFRSPLATAGSRTVLTDELVQTTLFCNPRPRRRSDGNQVFPQIEVDQDLAWAMEFEHRKEDATRRRREEIRAAEREKENSSSSVPKRSPHKNRYHAAIASLGVTPSDTNNSDTSVQSRVPFKTALPEGDPRGYLMKRQKSFAANNSCPEGQPIIMRTKSNRLPLETIPHDEHLHKLIHSMRTDMEQLQSAMDKLVEDDMYVRCGCQSVGLRITAAETQTLVKKIQSVVSLWVGDSREQKCEVEYCFKNLLNSE